MTCPERHQVDLYFATAIDSPAEGAELLSADELDRASRFHREQDRLRYIAAHVLLRRALARYCQVDATDIAFAQLEFGKPVLALADSVAPVHFSLSDSGDHAAVAICRSSEIGIDIEVRRSTFDPLDLARACMTDDERDLIAASGDRSHGIFLELWTAKEAVLKASGFGLAINPANLQIAGIMTGRLFVETVADKRLSAASWRIAPVSSRSWTGAIATRDTDADISIGEL